MKTWLLPEKGNFYKANLHCHSTVSDGRWSLEKLKEEYQKRGYSVIAFSDHDYCHSHPELNDGSFLALTSFEADISDNVVESSHYRRCYHLNCIAKNELSDGAEILPTPNYRDLGAINEYIAKMNEKGFLVSFNHPNWSLQNVNDYAGLKGLFASEIYTHAAYVEGIDSNQEMAYDHILRAGNRIRCLMTDDNHDEFPADHPLNDSFGGYVVIKAQALAYPEIISALEAGNFYSSMGPEIYSLYVENNRLYVECSPARSINMTTAGRRCGVARAAAGQTITRADFAIEPDDGYVRLQITDREGLRANTNAFFIDGLE